MDQGDLPTYIVVYCTRHNYGKILDKQALEEEYDLEGDLRAVVSLFNICKKGVLKKTPCSCVVHGVMRITNSGVVYEPAYGNPHDITYPKGWKLKYYLNEISKEHSDYVALNEYFHKK